MAFANGEKGEMMRLIDADALYKSFGATGNCNNCPLDAYKCQYYNEHTLMEFCERIEDAPTIDVEPVRHGHWVGVDDEPCNVWECDVCGWIYEDDEPYYRYCPHCGAKMEVENEDD